MKKLIKIKTIKCSHNIVFLRINSYTVLNSIKVANLNE